MDWFSLLKRTPGRKGRKAHMSRRAKEVRAYFRPIVFEAVERKFSNSKEVGRHELSELVDEVVTVERFKRDNPDSEIREVKTYTVKHKENYIAMVAYKLREMGFEYIQWHKKYVRD